MNSELLRLVDSIHRDKGIDVETVFTGIESALVLAAKKHYGEDEDIEVRINRQTGAIEARHGTLDIDTELLGRIAAQSGKQIMMQRFREAERDALFDEYSTERGQIVTATVTRVEGNLTIVTIGRTEAILPRGEQLPGESFRPGERVKAIIREVRKAGQRIKIVLSRVHPDFVRRLFEQEIPEIAEGLIEIRSIAREAGFRTKMAVSSIDSNIDSVGACVGSRGARIKGILEELKGERIDVVKYSDSLQTLIPAALAPAQVEEVQVYNRLGRAIVLVKEDQLSLAIGKRGQNVRLASHLCGIDVDIMTIDELTQVVEQAEEQFSQIDKMPPEAIDHFIEEGVFNFSDLSVMEPEAVMEIAGVDEDTAFDIIEFAEDMEEQLPTGQSTRSNMLTGTESRQSAIEKVQQILGGEDIVAKPQESKQISASELLGGVPESRPAEDKKISVDQLFSSSKDEPNTPEEDSPST